MCPPSATPGPRTVSAPPKFPARRPDRPVVSGSNPGDDIDLADKQSGGPSAAIERQFNRLMDGFPEPLLVSDAAGVLRWVNRAAAELTGWTARELEGRPLDSLISTVQMEAILRARSLDQPGYLTRFHCVLSTKSGDQREVSVSGGPLFGGARGLRVHLLRDLRRQREWERRLAAQVVDERAFAAFGRTSSRLIHDLRHLASILALAISNLRTYFRDPAFQQDAVDAVGGVADRIMRLIEQFSGARARSSADLQETTLEALVRSALDLLAGSCHQSQVAATELRGLDAPLRCAVDIDGMQRAILNLLLNAYEAVEGGGQVRITAYRDRRRQQVGLVIEDTGPGIPASYLEQQLFRPFQSTKAEGFGLGLYHAKAVVEAQGGSIEVQSRKDRRGSRVTVTLPGVKGGAHVTAERTHRRG